MSKVISFKKYKDKKFLEGMKEVELDFDTKLFYRELENIEEDIMKMKGNKSNSNDSIYRR